MYSAKHGMQLGIEILLGVASLFLGGMWWSLFKRDAYLRGAVNDETVLNGLSRELLESPPARIGIYAAKHELGYAMNLHILIKADRKGLRIPKLLFGGSLVLALVGSYMLGWRFLLINIGLICLAGLQRVPESAKANALEQLASIAVIFHKWNAEDPAECEAFIQKAHSLSHLYATVLRLTTHAMSTNSGA
jgi:hypothetical protein